MSDSNSNNTNDCSNLSKNSTKRTYSLLGPLPKNQFGPKASATSTPASNEMGLDNPNKKLSWSRAPENVLIIKKIDTETLASFKDCALWLVADKKLTVFVEKNVLEEDAIKKDDSFRAIFKSLRVFEPGQSSIDLIICLGGDGTLLYAASLFQYSMPPVVPFHMGSLGFLTSHRIDTMKETLNNVFSGQAPLMLRSRLRCTVSVSAKNKPPAEPSEPSDVDILRSTCVITPSQTSYNNHADNNEKSFLVLNEVSVHRGMSSCLCNVDLFLMERQITSVQGDGLVISTPTGSTGYAVAAGASVVHPQVPSIMVTPICPHSLSFRPLIVPAGAELKLAVSENARAPVNVSFDGRDTMQLHKGDTLTVRTSTHPTPCVCKSNPFDDWFDSLSECLLWNSRLSQKKLQQTT